MFSKIAGTVGTRVVGALLTLAIAVLNARLLGAANVGTIYLITLSVTLIQLFSNFIGGSAMIYMTPRAGFMKLFLTGYSWSLVITLLSTSMFGLLGILWPALEVIPKGWFPEILCLALLMSFASVNLMLILGKENVRMFNVLSLLQMILLLALLLFLAVSLGIRSAFAYYWGMLLSYFVIWILSFIPLRKFLVREELAGIGQVFYSMLRFGSYAQFANIFQLMNYRIGFWLVDFWYGRAKLGVMGLGFSISEGLWIVGRSMALVQFTRISNAMDFRYSVNLTLLLSKITVILTFLGVLVLLLLPETFFTWIFGDAFSGIGRVILFLAPGIVALSFSMILSHFFSGVNMPYHNTISSLIGLAFSVILGLILVPRFGIVGASAAASVSYSVSTIYQTVFFLKVSGARLRDLAVTRQDVNLAKDVWKNLVSGTGQESVHKD